MTQGVASFVTTVHGSKRRIVYKAFAAAIFFRTPVSAIPSRRCSSGAGLVAWELVTDWTVLTRNLSVKRACYTAFIGVATLGRQQPLALTMAKDCRHNSATRKQPHCEVSSEVAKEEEARAWQLLHRPTTSTNPATIVANEEKSAWIQQPLSST